MCLILKTDQNIMITKIKVLTGTAMVASLLLTSVAFAQTGTMSSTSTKMMGTSTKTMMGTSTKMMNDDKKDTKMMKSPTLKACIKAAKDVRDTAIKTAKDTLAQQFSDAKAMTDKVAAKASKTASRKAYRAAIAQAGTDYKTARAACSTQTQ